MNGRPPLMKSPLKMAPQKIAAIYGSPQIMPTASPLQRKYLPKPNNHRSNGKNSKLGSPSHRERIDEFNKMAFEAQNQILDTSNMQNLSINFEDYSRNNSNQQNLGLIPDSMESITKVEAKDEGQYAMNFSRAPKEKLDYGEFVRERLARRRQESTRTLQLLSPMSPKSPSKPHNAEFAVAMKPKPRKLVDNAIHVFLPRDNHLAFSPKRHQADNNDLIDIEFKYEQSDKNV